MASVFLQRGVWYLSLKSGAGAWVKVRTAATTKTEARRLLLEADRKAERERLGLDPLAPEDGGGTVAELIAWWLENVMAGKSSHGTEESRVRVHLLKSELAPMKLAQVRAEHVEAFLAAKSRQDLSAESLNKLRGTLSRAFNSARRLGRWAGENPIAGKVGKRKGPRRSFDYLRPHEIAPTLAMVSPQWRALVAVAIYTGLRKGELLALQKGDVDLHSKLLTVARSHGRDTVKGGAAMVVPLAAEALPWLEAAIKASSSELVFPTSEGKRHRADVDLVGVLRRAMGRAGIVEGWWQVCRKKGCSHQERTSDKAPKRCPVHGMRLWPKPIVRAIRFHDIRHTTASLLTMSGANPRAVQRLLRHSDPRMTERYTHLSPDFLRAEVDRLVFGVPSELVPAPVERPALAANAEAVFHPFPQEAPIGAESAPTASAKLSGFEGLQKRAIEDSNLWPLAPEANALSS